MSAFQGDPEQLFILEMILARVEETYEEIQKLDSLIITNAEDGDIDNISSDLQQFNEETHEKIFRIKRFIGEKEKKPIEATPSSTFRQARTPPVSAPHKTGLKLAHPPSDAESFEISLLIGTDYYWDFIEDDIVQGPGPTAVLSKFGGYLLSGPTGTRNAPNADATTLHIATTTVEEEMKLQNYWDLETIGIRDQVNAKDTKSRDFIEEVDDDDKANGHYLPHRSVKKDSTTTPIRVVYDCSCRQSDSPSLNDCLQTGPPLLNDLSSILLRFRVHDIALSSDIEKAFLNVRLDENDRKFTKFLWLSDPSDPESPFKVYRFKTVLFGAVCSPFILNAVVKTHLESNNNTPIAADLKDNIYVDNVISGVNNTTEATKYYTDANSLMKSAGLTFARGHRTMMKYAN
ncbi:uncharacterized protein [Ptychodera flava]|uniref:uncharacterized protein n=1 Tax=Ptychodera flava TaxID=63121 RepID=UPI003969C375